MPDVDQCPTSRELIRFVLHDLDVDLQVVDASAVLSVSAVPAAVLPTEQIQILQIHVEHCHDCQLAAAELGAVFDEAQLIKDEIFIEELSKNARDAGD